MNIVVLMKQVPDTEGDRKLTASDNTVDRAAVDPVINYIDEFAI
jgi:electron transfer flavoprotein beta subunit